MASDWVWLRRYSAEPPGRFAALLAEGEQRGTCLRELQRWFMILIDFESYLAQNRTSKLQVVWEGLPWAASPWVREIFCALDECEFRTVPGDIARELEAVSQLFKHSVFCERAFNLCRDRSRHAKSGFQGSMLSFHTVLNSNLMDESDRPQGAQRPSQGCPSSFPTSNKVLFDAMQCDEFSLDGEGYLKKMMDAPEALSTTRFLASNLVWEAVQACHGRWPRLEDTWHCLLPRKFAILRSPQTSIGLVVHTSPHAVLLVSMDHYSNGAHSYVRFRKDGYGKLSFQVRVLIDSEGWTSRLVQILPPCDPKYQQLSAVDQGAPCMYLDLDKPARNILKAAAMEGFKGLTVPQMAQIIDYYSVPWEGQRPTKECDITRLLVSWQFPKWSDEQVSTAVGARSEKCRQQPFATVLTPENVEHLKDVAAGLDKDEIKGMSDTADKFVSALKSMPKARVALPPTPFPSGAASSSSGVTGPPSSEPLSAKDWRLLPGLPEGSIEQPQAKEFLPSMVGCVISVHQNSRWMVKYPREVYPRSHSASFTPGDESSILEALRAALLWAWRSHKEKTGQGCPWNLGEPV